MSQDDRVLRSGFGVVGLEESILGTKPTRHTSYRTMLWTGAIITAVHALFLLVDTHVVDSETFDGATRVVSTLLPFGSLTFLIIGELDRRGDFSLALARDGLMVVRQRMLSARWHTFWIVACLAVNAWLLWQLVTRPYDTQVMTWFLNGVFAAGALGALMASGVKKWAWSRGGSGRRLHVEKGTLRQQFWRWFSYRWRLDLWCAGVGIMFAGFGLVFLLQPIKREGEVATEALWIIVPALCFFAFSLWVTTQFWRSGEDLARVEGVRERPRRAPEETLET